MVTGRANWSPAWAEPEAMILLLSSLSMRQTSMAQEPGLAGRTSPGEDKWGNAAQGPSRERNRTCPFSWFMLLFSRSVVSDSLRPHGLQPTRLLWSMGFPRQEYWIAIFLLLVQKDGRAPSPSRCHFMLAGLLVPQLLACLRSLQKKSPSTVGGGGLMFSAKWFMQDIQMPGYRANALGLPKRRVPFSQLHQVT